MDPRVVAQEIDRDWLWLRHGIIPNHALPGVGHVYDYEIDVKAKRRLKDKRILFIAAADAFGGGGTLSFGVLARSLLKIKSSG